jgi:hypothetical protein
VTIAARLRLPKVHLHNPVLAYETGADFLNYWYLAEQGKLDPFVLVVEWKVPFRTKKSRRKGTGRHSEPIPTPDSPSPLMNGLTGWRPKRSR